MSKMERISRCSRFFWLESFSPRILLQPCKPSMGHVDFTTPEAKAAKNEKKKAEKDGVLKGWAWELKMAQDSPA